MPNKKSAIKRVLIAEKNRLYNRFWKTRCKNCIKKFLDAVNAKDIDLAQKRYDEAQSVLDKAVDKGVLHRNTAARRKKGMAAKLSPLKQ